MQQQQQSALHWQPQRTWPAQVSCSPAPPPLVPMLLGPVSVTPLYELRLSLLPLIAQLLLLLPMAQLQSIMLPLLAAEECKLHHATISIFLSAAAMPAATSTINASRGTSATASGGLHSSTPVDIAAASNARAASTAAGTAALAVGTAHAVGTAFAVTAGIAAPAARTPVRAVVKAAPVASRIILLLTELPLPPILSMLLLAQLNC